MIKAILFDLDGTLVDTLMDLANAANRVLEMHGLPGHELDAYRRFVGNGAKNLMMQCSGATDEALIERLYSDFLTVYDKSCLETVRPYDGTVELLDELIAKGYRLGVVTNKPHEQALRIVENLFGDRFLCVFGGCDRYPRKPDPASVMLAAQQIGVAVKDCLFVGDSDVDVRTAHAAGIPCVGCSFGFRGEEELRSAGADGLINKFSELTNFLLLFE